MKFKKNNTTKLLCLKSIIIMLCAVMISSYGVTVASASGETLTAYSYGETVYLGGMPVGITLNLDGLMVTKIVDIPTNRGGISPAKNGGIRVGDLITSVNGLKVLRSEELTFEVAKSNIVALCIVRDSCGFTVNLTPVLDIVSNMKKIGLCVRDSTAGIGTMTYMRSNGEFAALGHPITDGSSANPIKVIDGKVFEAVVVGVNKGTAGRAGELKGMLKKQNGEIGKITANNKFGVFGTLSSLKYIDPTSQMIVASGKNNAKIGSAQILTTVAGQTPKLYDIEIVKCSKQRTPSDKSMVIKIVDKDLLAVTGGIVQGMSGSPIIQNGKLIGAVTHVFVNDPTRGYGIYIDWML